MPMPLTLCSGQSDLGWSAVSDVLVRERFSGESGCCCSFGDAGVGAVASGRVGSLQDLGDRVP